jgi:hypothetical protein
VHTPEVRFLYVATILTQVQCDGVSAGSFSQQRYLDRVWLHKATEAIGLIPVTSLPKRGSVVDVDPQVYL